MRIGEDRIAHSPIRHDTEQFYAERLQGQAFVEQNPSFRFCFSGMGLYPVIHVLKRLDESRDHSIAGFAFGKGLPSGDLPGQGLQNAVFCSDRPRAGYGQQDCRIGRRLDGLSRKSGNRCIGRLRRRNPRSNVFIGSTQWLDDLRKRLAAKGGCGDLRATSRFV